jgi:hypothetical protein
LAYYIIQSSSVVIGMSWKVGVRFPPGAGDFSFLHIVQTGSGGLLAFYPVGIGVYFTGGEATGT